MVFRKFGAAAFVVRWVGRSAIARGRIFVLLVVAMFSISPEPVAALPFNQDMVGNQLVTGSIMRPKSPGSVPMGALKNRIEADTKPQDLINPIPGQPVSVENGKRLFSIHCQVCHGRWEDGKHVGNTLNAEIFKARNLADRKSAGSGGSYQDMSDGRIFLAVHFGKGLMPAYGWKLSSIEHWDLVNYVQHARAEHP